MPDPNPSTDHSRPRFIRRTFALSLGTAPLRTEALAGLTTFLTMAYIIFVQPAVLSGAMFPDLFPAGTGLPAPALTVSVCLAAALGCVLMALLANYPVALAPGMGGNFLLVLSVIPAAAAAGHPAPFRTALAVVFIAGVLFLALTALGLRGRVLTALSPSLKHAIAVGIGLFIAFIGLRNCGLIRADPGSIVSLATPIANPDIAVFAAGLLVTVALAARRVRGAIFFGIAAATAAACALKLLIALPALAASPVAASSRLATDFAFASSLVAPPPSLAPVLFQLDFAGALTAAMIPYILIFLFIDVFDTLGTLVGVSDQAGLLRPDGSLPGIERAFWADALATSAGAALGHSNVTSYIESASGVEVGGRTGATALVVAALFLLSIFFTPVIAMVGSYAPITAPALVVVGAMMLGNIRKLDWDDPTELIPAFLIILGIPLSFSIADGIALGLILHPLAKLLAGRARQTTPTSWILAALLLLYFTALRTG